MSIKIINGALDENPQGDIVFRGVLDSKSLNAIHADSYQREVMPLATLSSICKALSAGQHVPDITLGMRGGNYLEKDDATYLQDEVYVVDGLQRLSGARHLMQTGKMESPRLGCVVYFNTTYESEASLFRILNTRSVKLSPNILLRNMKSTSPFIEMVYNLCYDKNFAMEGRVSWNQRMRRTELLRALTLIKTIGSLHSTWGPGLSTGIEQATKGLDKTMLNVGRNTMRENIKTFFEVIDGAFGIRTLAFKESAPYLKGAFLFACGLLFAGHQNFWNDTKKLIVTPDWRRKLGTFPINDPGIQALCGSGSTSRFEIMIRLAKWMNSGKRSHRLKPFKDSDLYQPDEPDASEPEPEGAE